ncbi:prolyl oligopeptidase family serine peptidase [bacterium]|nr:prolyl oligopeptidase family serine peptidase [bacterium]
MKSQWILFGWLVASSMASAQEPPVNITPDVVYGHKDGLAMTFDVFTPKEKPNGAAVLFMVSGGWYSNWTPPQQTWGMFYPLTSKGFTVFAVRHGSSPKYGIPDAVSDVRRSVRYIRMNAETFHIDPNRIGVYGMSAGGHLSLMLGTASDDGLADNKDPVMKVSDRVQAVVAFVAPTDLTIAVREAPNRLPAYDRFPALDLAMAPAKAHSPLFQVTADDAPTLLIVGVKDDLVPIAHSQRIQAAFNEQKVVNKLVEYPNSGHGLVPMEMQQAATEMVAWFETHLAAPK